MQETLLNVGDTLTLEMALAYYQKLGIAVEVNDGKDVTLKIEGRGNDV